MSKKFTRKVSTAPRGTKNATDFTRGYLIDEAFNDGMDARKRVMELAKAAAGHDGGGISKWRAKGMFCQKLEPWNRFLDREVRVVEEKEIIRLLKSGKYSEDEAKILNIRPTNKNVVVNSNHVNGLKYVVFIADVHVNAVLFAESENVDDYFRIYEDRVNEILQQKGIEKDECLLTILGDLTDFGLEAEFYLIEILLERLNFRNVAIVPGNHDLSVYFGCLLRSHHQCRHFGEIVLGCQYAESNFSFQAMNGTPYFPRVMSLSNDVHLVLVDSCETSRKHHTANGTVGKDQMSRLESILKGFDESKDHVIVCLHHHPVFPRKEDGGSSFDCKYTCLTNEQKFRGCLMRYGVVKRVMFGHLHKSFPKQFGREGKRILCQSVASIRHDKKEFCFVLNLENKEFV